jgi:hypothetical protein
MEIFIPSTKLFNIQHLTYQTVNSCVDIIINISIYDKRNRMQEPKIHIFNVSEVSCTWQIPDHFQTGLGLPPIPYTTGQTEPGSTGMGARP